MIHIAKPILTCVVAFVLSLGVLLAWPILQAGRLGPPPYPVYFGGTSDSAPDARWHMIIYLDINSCLTCTEDMDAWRALESDLNESGGDLTLWAPPADSLDVAEAMRLEGMNTPVRVLNSGVFGALGWERLGTPVKVLLDNQWRPVKIAGRMGNVRESTCFFDSLKSIIDEHDESALASR